MKRCSRILGVLFLPAFLLTAALTGPITEASDLWARVAEMGAAAISDEDETVRTELKVIPRPDTLAPSRPPFELGLITEGVLKEFRKAWRVSKAGTSPTEGVVLLFRRVDGRYMGRSMGATNQYKAFTFTWVPNAIAIVHTHPNVSDPRPNPEDMQIADRLNVPVLTITTRGMYMYDPGTKKITMLLDGLDWLDYPRAYENVARR